MVYGVWVWVWAVFVGVGVGVSVCLGEGGNLCGCARSRQFCEAFAKRKINEKYRGELVLASRVPGEEGEFYRFFSIRDRKSVV